MFTNRVNVHNFDNICRFCLEQRVFLKPLFSEDDGIEDDFASDDGNGNLSTTEMVKLFTGMELSPDDSLPNFVCSVCLDKLLQSNKFRLQCLKSEEILKEAVSRYQNGEEDECDAFNIFSEDSNKPDFTEINIERDELEGIEEVSDILFTIEPLKQEDELEPGEEYEEVSNDSLNDSEGITLPNEKDGCNNLSDGDDSREYEEIQVLVDENEEEGPVKVRTRKKLKASNPKHPYKQCQVCGLMSKGIKLHMLTHTGEKKHKCPYCDKLFSQKGNLSRHVNIHLNIRKYKCTICENAFTDPKALKSHTITHTKEKNYICDMCGKAFGYSNTLLVHKRSHVQDRRHECNVCHKWFLTKYDMKKHFRIHTGERPYKCEICGKCFTTSGNLSIHKKVHRKTLDVRLEQ